MGADKVFALVLRTVIKEVAGARAKCFTSAGPEIPPRVRGVCREHRHSHGCAERGARQREVVAGWRHKGSSWCWGRDPHGCEKCPRSGGS